MRSESVLMIRSSCADRHASTCLPIERQNLEPLAPLYAYRPKVWLIERQYLRYIVPFGQYDDRSIRKADLEIGIFLDHFLRPRDVRWGERFQLICATSNFVQ
jgi:hypothetical protein